MAFNNRTKFVLNALVSWWPSLNFPRWSLGNGRVPFHNVAAGVNLEKVFCIFWRAIAFRWPEQNDKFAELKETIDFHALKCVPDFARDLPVIGLKRTIGQR